MNKKQERAGGGVKACTYQNLVGCELGARDCN